MAAIDTLSGVTETSRGYYEVTSVVDIGSGIDDVSDATFFMHTGGLLRWVSGCTTTFTRCVFIESETAQALGVDNFNKTSDDFVTPAARARFHETGTTHGDCAPIFKGCTWQVLVATRSDFDVSNNPRSAGPTFERDEYGQPCNVFINPAVSQFNHFASDYLTINGLVVNHYVAANGAFEFAKIPLDYTQFRDLTVVDNHPASGDRHVVVLSFNTPAGESRTINRLSCRNIACYETGADLGNSTILLDPKGFIPIAQDSVFSYRGALHVSRTLGADKFVDLSTGTQVSVRAVVENSAGDILNDTTATSYAVPMLQYIKPYNSTVFTSQGSYKNRLAKYGYYSQQSTVTPQDTTNFTEYVSTVTAMTPDEYITESNTAVVEAYVGISSANELYDSCRLLEAERNDFKSEVGKSFISVDGSTLDFGALDVIVDPALGKNIAHRSTSQPTYGTAGVRELVSAELSNPEYNASGLVIADSIFTAIETAIGASGLNWTVPDMVYSSDGMHLYVHVTATDSDASNTILQYDLTTAFDASTATYVTRHTQFINGQPCSLTIVPDGSRIWLCKRWSRWYYLDLSTPYDLSTNGGFQQFYAGSEIQTFGNVIFNGDGTKMWSFKDANGGNSTVIRREWTLSTPYDHTTRGAYTETTLSASGTLSANIYSSIYSNSYQIIPRWNADGTLFTLSCPAGSSIWVRKMTTPYDLSEITTWETDTTLYTIPDAAPAVKFAMTYIDTSETAPFMQFHPHDYSDSTNNHTVYTSPIISNYQTGGLTNTLYISSSSLAATAQFDNLRTTGTITLQNGATTDMILTDVNGTLATVTVSGIIPGSRIHIDKVTGGYQSVSTGVVSGTTHTFQYYTGDVINAGDTLEIKLLYCDGTQLYDWWETTMIVTEFGGTAVASQTENTAYAQLGVDGSTVTEFTLDFPNIEVDLNDPDGQTQKRRFVAWFFYACAQTDQALDDYWEGVRLLDPADAVINTGQVNLVVDNVGTQQVLFTDSDFLLRRDDGTSWIKFPSSGNYGIVSDSGKIYIAETGVSGLTAAESTQLFSITGGATASEVRAEIDANSTQLASIKSTVEAIPTDNTVDLTAIEADLQTINEGIKKSSKLVPHGTDLP